ncbi:MAG: hypothetical protein ABIR79_07645 [Candidatus Binatia bacterium]
MPISLLQRLGLRGALAAAVSLLGLIANFFIWHNGLVGSACFGALIGSLLPLLPRQKVPYSPFGLGWKIAWTVCVLLAIASFVASLFGRPTVGFGLLFSITAAWGLFIHRYRNRMLALPGIVWLKTAS